LNASGRAAHGAWRVSSPAARLAGALLMLLLVACAQIPRRASPAHPGAPAAPVTVLPRNAPDVDQIPDAVPRDEPRSPFGNPPSYSVGGHRYEVLASANGYVERGVASWYGTEFHGLRTSTGESYDMFAMTAAHKTLPLPCYARVTNLSNGRHVVVRINDRGPFIANRIIDLSYSAAAKLDMIRSGTAFVQVEVLNPAAPTITAALPVNAPAAQAAMTGVSNVPAAPVSAMYIQVGAYSRAENAAAVAQKLRGAGFQGVITLSPDAHQPLQRVRIGPISNVQQFDGVIGRLAALGFPGARLAQE
jgi:rare lipoprotein A